MSVNETFRWGHKIYKIDRINLAINKKEVTPELIALDLNFIKSYCQCYLDKESPGIRPPIDVEGDHALSLTKKDLSAPILLAHVGNGEGLVYLQEDEAENHYVVIDGNHRLLAARRLNQPLKAYVLNQKMLVSFEINEG